MLAKVVTGALHTHSSVTGIVESGNASGSIGTVILHSSLAAQLLLVMGFSGIFLLDELCKESTREDQDVGRKGAVFAKLRCCVLLS